MTGLFLALAGCVVLAIALAKWRGHARGHAAPAGESIPPAEWDAFLRREFFLYTWMPSPLRTRLLALMAAFLKEKRFEACGDLPRVTDNMRLLIAAQACLLLAGRNEQRVFPRLRSILVYPAAFRDRGRRVFGIEAGDDTDRDIRLGESWDTGSVILAWDGVREGAAGKGDGVNVVMHEFAHQLDQASGGTDGAPALGHAREYEDWAEVMRRDFESLVRAANDPRADPLLDPYGAENPAEFFAVATETFFEMSEDMRFEHPDLYAKLREFYGVDPAEWTPERG